MRSTAERLAVVLLACVALGVAGCGGDDKPGYCSDVDDLEQSVKDLGDTDVLSGGKDAVTAALKDVDTNARAAVDSAKDDFPDETTAISDSVSKLKASTQKLADSVTPEQAARTAVDVKAVVTAVGDFVDATGSECD
jgi:hypothetical protein